MRNKQLGISLGGLVAVSVVLIAVAIVGIKLVPSYIEFMAIKKVVNDVGREKKGGASVAELRKSFDLRGTVDGIESVKGADLEITKEGSDIVIAARYRKEIPLVGNMGIYINFAAVSKE